MRTYCANLRIWVSLVLFFGLIFTGGSALSDDIDIYATGGEGLDANILIIFDNSGSMNDVIEGGLYDPGTTYEGDYHTDWVYCWDLVGKRFYVFKYSINWISCSEAKTALQNHGYYTGCMDRYGRCQDNCPWPIGYWMGNFLNYMDATLPPEDPDMAKIDIAKEVIKDFINATTGVRIGIMKFNYEEGGTLQHEIMDMTPENRTLLCDSIDALVANTWTPLAETLYEAGLYFSGAASCYNPGVSYTTPITDWCQKNFVILMTDGEPTYDGFNMLDYYTVIDDPQLDSLGDVDGDKHEPGYTDEVTYGSYGSDYLDDVAKYLYDNDLIDDTVFQSKQNIVTYTIGFDVDNQLLVDTAVNGHGAYYTASNGQQLTTAFQNIIKEILEVSTSFSAPVVPISQMEKTSSGDRIYLALFKPTQDAFWTGNIKKFGLATVDNPGLGIEEGDILDKNGNPATTDNGYIYESAFSYWAGDTADGGETERGGVGEILLNRDPDTRNIYTWVKKNKPITHSENAFEKGNSKLKKKFFDVSHEEDKDKIIDFVRGHDAYDEDEDHDTTETRPWILGACLHSRPEIVHYDANTTLIFAGANDGMLHAFDDSTGEELWAYIPPTLLGELKHLSGEKLAYYVDGSPKVYVKDANRDGEIKEADDDRAILVCGLRRGGRYYFALDVTDPNNPKIPDGWDDWGWYFDGDDEDDWQATGMIGYHMTTDRDEDEDDAHYPYDEMGQSWATPVFGTINDGGSPRDVMFISAGYDNSNQDQTYPDDNSDDIGRGIYVVDPLTAERLWKYTRHDDSDMRWSVPSDIAAIDTTGNGFIDRLYAGDMGARMWRFDIGNPEVKKWDDNSQILFDINNELLPGQKIFYPPDVTLEEGYELVFFATGDRAHPEATEVIDRMYAVKDTGPGPWIRESDLTDVTQDLLQESGDEEVRNQIRQDLKNGKGWYIKLDENLGEKVLGPSIVFGGVVYFTTFSPTKGAMEDPCFVGEGTARLYALNYRTGEAVLDYDETTQVIGKSDRSVIIGTAIPSGLVIAILHGKPAAYIGIKGGILKADVGNPAGIYRIFWRLKP
jgi:type IV pilus assembly protein PilY1